MLQLQRCIDSIQFCTEPEKRTVTYSNKYKSKLLDVILESSEGMNTYIHFLHLQCLSYILKKYIEKYIAMPASVHDRTVHALSYFILVANEKALIHHE
jgi:hypothetical protein